MSDVIDARLLPPTNEPLRLAVRRLRWFSAAFRRHVDAVGVELGCRFVIDEGKVASIFVRWLQALDAQRPTDRRERAAFFEFAASLVMRELAANMPIRAEGPPTRAATDSPGAFWPEGYACAVFCLSVHCAAMEQEFKVSPRIEADFDTLRFWWSFRENIAEDSGMAAGFLQKMLGHEPNWQFPTAFRLRIGDWLFVD